MILRSCFHQNQRFALTTIVNAHFWAFWNAVYSKISMDATAFCSNHVWKRWFWPQKLSMNAPRFESAFWNAVYSKSAFWNAVYSKISMDATAFCSNHVWKRWFWPQKLSMNAPRFESAFWNAVYSKSAFWNAVYSKISMDATAFCSNHVWKRWFWPQKLSINAPSESQSAWLLMRRVQIPGPATSIPMSAWCILPTSS